ncbi:MAG: class II aldolase/adducin family protein [Anaerolineales bacterium]|nr:class II aldolase/adducin family protein [Anaerolineales bacterium]MDP2776532.1 class II aldolase/adducin family protein [Anaerolineales bacterium]
MILEELRAHVLQTALFLPKYNLVWMAGGTVCARDPQTGYVVVTPSGLDYERLTPNDMIVTDLDANLVEGKFRPSVALNLWIGFMRARSELNAVVHTHSPYATAFSVVYQSIPVITETMADWFGQPVPVTRYLSVEDPDFPTLPVEVMGNGYAILLGNHGPITVGKTLEHALERAVTLEEAARTYSIAQTISVPVPLTDEQARASFDYYHNRYGQRKS